VSEQRDLLVLPPDLPAPVDDGASRHLPGRRLPPLSLPASDGGAVQLHELGSGRTILYCYPRTGRPGEAPLVPEWDRIPGARGCTPQTCEFRDHYAELRALGAGVFGVSTQDTAYQREMVERLHVPFEVLSDAELRLARALRLPTFTADGKTLLKRVTLVLRDCLIEHVFYPVFPPDQNAAEVLAWLAAHPLES
jgi:peroxiredoxin